jgi:putative sigma-54 modulation protein
MAPGLGRVPASVGCKEPSDMRIDVIGKHMAVTEAIKTFAEQKAGKLPRYNDLIQQITVRLEQLAHNKGFTAEVVADVEHHDDFVATGQHEDLYAAIDGAMDKVARQLHDFKEVLKEGKKGKPSASGPSGLGGMAGGASAPGSR